MALKPPAAADTPRKRWQFFERAYQKWQDRFNAKVVALGPQPSKEEVDAVKAAEFPAMKRILAERDKHKDEVVGEFMQQAKSTGRADSKWDTDINLSDA